eukprot:g4079.t1
MWMSKLSNVALDSAQVNKSVLNYFTTKGYKEAAECFSEESKLSVKIDGGIIDVRMQVRSAILSGDVVTAIKEITKIFPDILDTNARLSFLLTSQALIEKIRESKVADAIAYAQSAFVRKKEKGLHLAMENGNGNGTVINGKTNGEFTEEEYACLEEIMGLLAFTDPTNPVTCPGAYLLQQERRNMVAEETNSALLNAQDELKEARLLRLIKLLLWSQKQLQTRRKCPRIEEDDLSTAKITGCLLAMDIDKGGDNVVEMETFLRSRRMLHPRRIQRRSTGTSGRQREHGMQSSNIGVPLQIQPVSDEEPGDFESEAMDEIENEESEQEEEDWDGEEEENEEGEAWNEEQELGNFEEEEQQQSQE